MNKTNYPIEAVNIKTENFRRPVINIKGASTLIDTGSTIPMFYFPVEALNIAFGGTKLIYDSAKVSGIGNGSEKGKIYELNDFSLDRLHYKNFQVFVPDVFYSVGEDGKNIYQEHPIVLSATMFEGCDYEFDTVNRRFIVNTPISIGYNMDFKLIKNDKDKLIPVVNGVFIQEEATVQYQTDTEAETSDNKPLSYQNIIREVMEKGEKVLFTENEIGLTKSDNYLP